MLPAMRQGPQLPLSEQYRHYEPDSAFAGSPGQGSAAPQRGPAPQDSHRAFCCLPAIAAGYLVSLLVMLEGVVVLCSITGRLGPSKDALKYLKMDSPLYGPQQALLWTLGVADVILALVAMAGLLMAKCPLPLGLHRCQAPEVASLCVVTLIPWRVLVTFLIAPWTGTTLAFSALPAASKGRAMGLAVAYVAVNLYFLWTLVPVAQATWQRARQLQRRLVQRDCDERRMRVQQLRYLQDIGWEEQPCLFGRVPLDFAVFVYGSVLLAVGSWGFVHVSSTGHPVGGWAALAPVVTDNTPTESTPIVLEMFLYLVCASAALVGLLGLLVHRVATLVQDDMSESLLTTRRRCSYVLMCFFIANCMRFALFIPVTGMALAADNVCGLYIHELSGQMAHRSMYQNSIMPLHCTKDDLLLLVLVAAPLALDAYLLWGSGYMWHRVHAGYIRQFQHLSLDGPPTGGYGAALQK